MSVFQVSSGDLLGCDAVVGYQHFRGPCFLHLQGEVASMGENSIDIGLDWRGVPLANRKCRGSGMATSATSVRKER